MKLTHNFMDFFSFLVHDFVRRNYRTGDKNDKIFPSILIFPFFGDKFTTKENAPSI